MHIHLDTNPSFTTVLKGMGLVRMDSIGKGEVLNDEEGSIYLIHVLIIPKTKEGKHTKYLTTFRIVQHF